MPLLRQHLTLSLLTRLLRYSPPTRLLPLSHSRSVQIRFFPPIAIKPQLIPPVDLEMLRPLLVSEGGNWTLSKDGFAIERGVQFFSFKETHKFIDALCDHAQLLGHHPEWSNIYNHIFIRLRTHKDRATGTRGISNLDLRFARFCDTEIIKQNGTSNTWRSLGFRGKVILEELEDHKEMAGKNSVLSSKKFRDSKTGGSIKSEKREEDEETRVSVDEPVVMPAREKSLRGLASEGQVEEQEGVHAQGEVSISAEFSGKDVHEPTQDSGESTYQDVISWGRILKEASELGIPQVRASRQIQDIVSAYAKENPSSSPSPAISSNASKESHPDQQPPENHWRHQDLLKDSSIDRPTLRTRTDRLKARAAASDISSSQEEPASTSSRPKFSGKVNLTNHHETDHVLRYREKLARKRAKRAKREANPTLPFSSTPFRSHDDESLRGTRPDSRNALQKVLKKAKHEATKKERKMEKRLRKKAKAVARAEELVAKSRHIARLKSKSSVTRPEPPAQRVPLEVPLDLPSRFSIQ